MDSEIVWIIYMLFLFLGALIGVMTMVIVFEKRRIEDRKEREKLSRSS